MAGGGVELVDAVHAAVAEAVDFGVVFFRARAFAQAALILREPGERGVRQELPTHGIEVADVARHFDEERGEEVGFGFRREGIAGGIGGRGRLGGAREVGKDAAGVGKDGGELGVGRGGGKAAQEAGAAPEVREAGGVVVEGGELPEEGGGIEGGDVGQGRAADVGVFEGVEVEQIGRGHLAKFFAADGEGDVEEGFGAAFGLGAAGGGDLRGELGGPDLFKGGG